MRLPTQNSSTATTVSITFGCLVAIGGGFVFQENKTGFSLDHLGQPSASPPAERLGNPISSRPGELIDARLEFRLLEQSAKGDLQWQPRAIPLHGGGTRYIYRRAAGEPAMDLDQIKSLIINPPTFNHEREAVSSLLRVLRQVGVLVVLGPPRKRGAAGEWEPRLRTMRIRGDVPSKGSQEFARVLNHESIHVAQSCRNGSIFALPVPLGLPRNIGSHIRKYLLDAVYADLSASDLVLEEEAYSSQDDYAVGVRLLRLYCMSS